MPRLIRRPLLTALALSLAAHFVFVSLSGRLWVVAPQEIGLPIEASLLPQALPESEPASEPADLPLPVQAPLPKPLASVVPPATQPNPEPETPAQLFASAPAVMEPPAPMPLLEPVAAKAEPAQPERKPEPEPIAEPEETRLARPALHTLPSKVEIRYGVQYGEGGFKAGVARYIWQATSGRYSIVSTLEATGLASLFMSGRIVQVSEGEITAAGLQPSQYWQQQGDKRQEAVRFLWGQNQLVLASNRGSVELTPQAQDLLSFPFQLAMTARDGEAPFSLGISNGRKFQVYGFQVIGPEQLELPGRHVETLHLRGGREGAGTLDVWLAQDTHRLPVQIRTLDQKGKQITLQAEEISLGH